MARLLNRKSAIVAMALGTFEAFRVARGQGTTKGTTSQLGVNAAEAFDLPALKREFGSIDQLKVQLGEIDQLRAQIAALTARVAAVEKDQAQTIGFTRTADGYAFAPSGAGSVTIHAPNGLTLKGMAVSVAGAGNVNVTAGATLSHRASMITLN